MWYLIIFFVAASGSSPGAAIETVEFPTQQACRIALSEVKKVEPWSWSHVDAVCVKYND